MKYLSCLAFLAYMILMSGCGNRYNETEKDSVALSDSTSIYGLPENDIKLVKTASINFKVKNVDSSVRSVSGIARKMGGMIFHMETNASEGGRNELKISPDSLLVYSNISPRAEITARIPSDNLEEFLYAVTDIGYYTVNNNLHIDDKSLLYLENILKNKNRRDVLAEPHSNFKKASLEENIKVKDEVAENDLQNRTIHADVNYSSVQLSLFQNELVKKEVIANYDLDAYQLPFGQRLGNAFSSGWQFFLNFMIAIAHLWVLLPLSIFIFIIYRIVNKKSVGNIRIR